MKNRKVNPGSLKATENHVLDMERVHGYYKLFKNKLFVEPVTLIREPFTVHLYLADGNHAAYGAFLAQVIEIDGNLLETDGDVRTELGQTKRLSTLDEALAYCREQHRGSKKIGIEFICDYGKIHPKPSDWNSH